jgi:hypothetical protein
MKPMQNTIAPRTPLTVTELETLATFLDNGTKAMGDARTPTGSAWDTELSAEWHDIFTGFYQIRDNTSAMVCGQQMPWDTAEGQVNIRA